jgi:hypothetical protein
MIPFKLSTGVDSTLKNYRDMCMAMFGADSKSVEFFNKKIEDQGEDEPVLSDEQQMIYLIGQMEGFIRG